MVTQSVTTGDVHSSISFEQNILFHNFRLKATFHIAQC